MIEAVTHQKMICIRCPGNNPPLPNTKFNRRWNCWVIPASPEAASRLIEAWPNARFIAPQVHALARDLKRAKAAKSAKNLKQPDGLKHDLWKHQLQAYHAAANLKGFFFIMGMGCGKTITAIADVNRIAAEKAVSG